MKLIKKFVFVVLFVSALTVNTYAGDQETPGYAPPPPPPPHSTSDDQDRSMAGDPTTVPPANEDAPEGTDTLLYDLLAALFSVF